MILSDAEIYKRCEWRSIPTMQDVAKIQHAETLQQLEREGLLKHRHSPNIVNVKPCRACAALREVRA